MEPSKKLINTKCIAPRLSLPLFMLSRNRIKYSKLNEFKRYIKSKNCLYDEYIDIEFESATLKHCQHVVGSGERILWAKNKENPNVQQKYTPKLVTKSWQLPPNLYDTSAIPYAYKRGTGGAHWPKDHKHTAKPRPNGRQPRATYYNFPKMTEKIFAPCNQSKGIFLTNARERRATTRCMVSNIATCYKNPCDPGPATYSPIDLKNTLSTSLKISDPHLFYHSSIVPVKQNSIHIPHTSFTPAPGRYETRYTSTCPCSSKFVYQPQINLLIEREKRKKFRRLSYEKINPRHYTSPDWRHVKGRGFHYLFIGTTPTQHKILTEQEPRRQKNIQLYPNSNYLSMINNPLRSPFSLRSSPFSSSMPHIKFNCTAKKIMRKHLKINKKIVFNSSQERFRDGYRLPILTQKQQEELTKALPLERQFRDHPIMNKRLSDIKSKLDQTPKHMLPNYMPKLRKKIFKFLPLPQAKALVTQNDTNVKEIGKEGFYLSLLEADKFFK